MLSVNPAAPPDAFNELRAPAHWQSVDLISDLHLQASEASTFQAWQAYLASVAGERPDALFILGDLFEVWVGDDVLTQPSLPGCDFWQSCASALHTYSQQTPVYFMAGNRDFLFGTDAAKACGLQILPDPTVLDFLDQRWLLSHGDALCLDDRDYMRFREQVRAPLWQQSFLTRPLAERIAIARELRQQSQARKQSTAHSPELWADVDTAAALSWLRAARAPVLIHGHTHRPAEHTLEGTYWRAVLSDWDLQAQPPRAEVLRLSREGLRRHPLCPG
jgi:UDP-2,3-diacylglucosamine hydrolase